MDPGSGILTRFVLCTIDTLDAINRQQEYIPGAVDAGYYNKRQITRNSKYSQAYKVLGSKPTTNQNIFFGTESPELESGHCRRPASRQIPAIASAGGRIPATTSSWIPAITGAGRWILTVARRPDSRSGATN
ncbi:hypothetical protein Taro_016846 [Colocasia esculenta]|uniref:Uncharacterized protein n=1 Tax=Colocasia esculenta TaxID=4460 RepID=A0A843ULX2_COLES|nr:hypothetical protein [Colocasia esculenta]